MIRGTLLVVLVLAGCSSSGGGSTAPTSTAPPMVNVRGSVTLSGDITYRDSNPPGSACYTPGNSPLFPTSSRYDDIREGAQAVITDAAGATVGVATLSAGRTTRFGTARHRPPCRYTFAVTGVPGGGSFYGLAVGGHEVQVPGAQLSTASMNLP